MSYTLFSNRHIGISLQDQNEMLKTVGVNSLEELIAQTIPSDIRLPKPMDLPPAMTEREFLGHVKSLSALNVDFDTYIGMGYYGTNTPAVILRNVFENPVWYTSYTPYQAEIAQGRLEALLNFQTMVSDLTGMPIANASLLDEATAAAEAMTMMFNLRSRDQVKQGVNKLFVDQYIFPQTLSVLHTRSFPQGVEVVVGDYRTFDYSADYFGAIVQFPNAEGVISDYRTFVQKAQQASIKVAVAADLMALVMLAPPSEWGADIVFGTTQRMGIPMGYGGPSAAYFATKENYKRDIPGRIVGVSKDVNGKEAYRLALQTREQHIKREKASSNICTAQALPAIMASFYAVYHGSEGLKSIASTIRSKANFTFDKLVEMGFEPAHDSYFDTLKFAIPAGKTAQELRDFLEYEQINVRYFDTPHFGISLDESTNDERVNWLLKTLAAFVGKEWNEEVVPDNALTRMPADMLRTTAPLNHKIFERYHTETELMRYIKRLDRKDISLTHSMISLGSCTMKLNAASEMLPLSWSDFYNIHPFVPYSQVGGYHMMFQFLTKFLGEITGLPAVSLQPNSGAAGEYAGLITIRNYQKAKGESHRNIVLIPASAHGTNPASAIQAGFEVVVTACDELGNVDVADLKAKAAEYSDRLAALMITYPSTHGVFEHAIREICETIHTHGAQVYMDGANMNAQVGLTSPGYIGADVCHLNLHKTFASPHGGGGPGMGPICVAEHLADYLPQHPFTHDHPTCTAVSAAPWGSASILLISYGYIRMMGAEGLAQASRIAILNANYLVARLQGPYEILFTGATGRVGHEMIVDCRPFKAIGGVTESDVAKRLMDFGYHAPTLSFPVHGTLMVEPTESESKAELDRFVEALLQIRAEIDMIAKGDIPADNNWLINAPHPEYMITADTWEMPYSRSSAAYPLEWVKENKFWVPVGRVDNAWGDRNLFCLCQGE